MSVVIVGTKTARSWDLGIWTCCKHSKSAHSYLWKKLVLCILNFWRGLTNATNLHLLLSMPVVHICTHPLCSMCFLLMCVWLSVANKNSQFVVHVSFTIRFEAYTSKFLPFPMVWWYLQFRTVEHAGLTNAANHASSVQHAYGLPTAPPCAFCSCAQLQLR